MSGRTTRPRSTHHHNRRVSNARDPTKTTTIRRTYAQKLRGHLAKLNTIIRRYVGQRDVFQLSANSRYTANQDPQDPTAPPVFRFDRDSQKVDRFMEWLERQHATGTHRLIERGDNQYIRQAYHRGLDHADSSLRDAGIDPGTVDTADVFNQPVHQDTVEMLYTRNYENLRGITRDMDREISEALTDGFARGANPNEMARDITDAVDSIGKNRATTMARTETIHAHTEAALTRYEEMEVDAVTVEAEILTAGDRRVCPHCNALSGQTFTIEQARNETFTSQGDQFPMRPPLHPQCRCAIVASPTRNQPVQ